MLKATIGGYTAHQNLWRKLSQVALKPQSLWMFSPSKVFRYTAFLVVKSLNRDVYNHPRWSVILATTESLLTVISIWLQLNMIVHAYLLCTLASQEWSLLVPHWWDTLEQWVVIVLGSTLSLLPYVRLGYLSEQIAGMSMFHLCASFWW